jgi:(p)ppGpp synthase/HD superfamily hydrolase
MTPWDPDIYAKAWSFASLHHRGQTYGGPREGEQIEYINHIASVAMEVSAVLQVEDGLDGNLAIQCALLHDTLEDTAATYDAVQAQFGPAVADGVKALSKDPAIADKNEKMHDSLRRIKLQPREVWMVKLADRIANLYHPPFYWDNRKILAYRDEGALIHTTLCAASPVLAERLQQKIDAYPQFLRPE